MKRRSYEWWLGIVVLAMGLSAQAAGVLFVVLYRVLSVHMNLAIVVAVAVGVLLTARVIQGAAGGS